ncbi:ImmA/IrrE family metallo-endopeptidase [Mesorhizobium sp. M0633]|uniref:ImmA/IrrE family metallo-endopeptidase n=1 Tax=Mesorhizobium sp. M0633 TaxID=2956977 RepID=UPI003336A62F
MSLLRRGFKTWCENAARGYRRELGLDLHGALNARQLAAPRGIRVWAPHEIPDLSENALYQLTRKDPSGWSAVTICVEDMSLIITNDRHSHERQNNSIMHELSHIILEHKPGRVFVSSTGQMLLSEYDRVQEEEANCLSGTLLVPRDALLHVLDRGSDIVSAARHFEVTRDLLQMRINLTGVGRQLAARKAR